MENNDPTKFVLVYANKTEEDIMFKDELDYLHRRYPDNFKMYHVIADPVNPHS